jgi:hypothetical protein
VNPLIERYLLPKKREVRVQQPHKIEKFKKRKENGDLPLIV